MSESNEVILLLHTVHDSIDEDVARAVLPGGTLVRACVEVYPERLTLEATLDADWPALAHRQRSVWDEKVKPLLDRYPQAGIAYFGLAPIPLAVHLGTLTERWPAIHVFQRRHDAGRSWQYAGGSEVGVTGADAPTEPSRSSDPAMIAINVTNKVDLEAARAAVGATSAEIEIGTELLGEDVLTSSAALQAVGQRFRRALDLIARNRPAATDVHLFAAVPCGLAFLLGTFVTSTRDPQVVTYQYHRGQEPRLREALRVPDRHAPSIPITAEQRVRAAGSRAAWEGQREALVAFLHGVNAAPWWNVLGKLGEPFAHGSMGQLQAAVETPLTARIDVGAADADGFRFDQRQNVWVLSDRLMAAIEEKVRPLELERAGRLLLLHEALHHGRQHLTLGTARQIRLAPKVLEELDYRADVWAMTHEFAYERMLGQPWSEQRQVLMSIIDTAVNTMWAFDADNERGFLEVRRINRYLVWYTQLVRLERTDNAEKAFAILADKPVVELVGPPVSLRDNRLVAKLDGSGALAYELVMLSPRGDLLRVGSTNALSVRQLAVAMGQHHGETVREALRAVEGR